MQAENSKAIPTKVSSISKRPFKGHVYNVTTETGNLFVEDILVHNSGGLGTPPHLRVECISADSMVSLPNGDAIEAKKLLERAAINSVELVGDAKVYHVLGIAVLGESDFKLMESPLYRVIERDVNCKLFRIKTRFGELIEVTGNHPLAVMSEEGIQFIPAEKVRGNEFLIKPRLISFKGVVPQIPIFATAKAPNSIHLLVNEANEDFCYWLGGMISEGDFTSFQYTNSKEYLCRAMAECFEKAVGFRPKIYRRKEGYFFTSFNRKEVSNLVQAMGLDGKIAKKKEIPCPFMSLPRKMAASLIAGLFDGDGSITKDGEMCFASTSQKLAFQVKSLLLRFGIQSSLSKRKQSWKSFKESDLFRVRIMDRCAIEIFFNEIPLKRKELKENCLYYLLSTSFSKTAKRKVVPSLVPVLDKIRKSLFLTQDEITPNRSFTNYFSSDPSFTKLSEMISVFKNRVDELQYLSLKASSGSWLELREIAKRLHLGHRKVRALSGRDFRRGYRAKASTLPFFKHFFSELCKNSSLKIQKELNLLKKVVAGGVAFDQIKSIETFNYKGKVYDLTTETGNFFSQGLLVHNCGMIHKSSGGVLFLDEIATLSPKAQQELLTAIQEKKYSITGQSELSSGAMTRTEPVPCNFVLVASGNYSDLKKVHPALRSRIRGYGYEIYMNLDMPDNEQNRERLVQFVAQEVKKDGKIPHFSRGAVEEIIFEAKRRAERKNRFTLKLRDLGGLIRAAGDIAKEKSHSLVQPEDVVQAKFSARTLEQQMVDKFLDLKKEYEVYLTEGSVVGRVNGLAVSSDGSAGMILPIEAEMAPAASRSEGKIIATGKLGEIAKEAVQNVSALIKKVSGKDVSRHDLHIQFLQTYEGVEGDSASVSVAAAVISAAEGIPIKQSLAMTGSLSVRGEVLPVGGISSKIQAAIKAGFKEVIIPKANLADIVLPEEQLRKVKVIPVSSLSEVLQHAFVKGGKTRRLLFSLRKILSFLPKPSGKAVAKKTVS